MLSFPAKIQHGFINDRPNCSRKYSSFWKNINRDFAIFYFHFLILIYKLNNCREAK